MQGTGLGGGVISLFQNAVQSVHKGGVQDVDFPDAQVA